MLRGAHAPSKLAAEYVQLRPVQPPTAPARAFIDCSVRSPRRTGRPARQTRLTAQATAQAVMASGADGGKTGVLFVCLGNICRSPAAEAVFRSKVEAAGLEDAFDIDSCGTGGGVRNWYRGARSYHEGGPADSRMMAAAAKRGIDITSTSRPLCAGDLSRFQYIIGMDSENMAAIQVAADYWAGEGQPMPKDYRDKVSLMCSHMRGERFKGVREVPDPYWDDSERGFNNVLDLLEDTCQGLLDKIQAAK